MIPFLSVVLFSVAVVLRVIPGPRTIDDAFITFRYARNLAQAIGFVYNPGQPVLGTTTPLYTLLLAALTRLTGNGDLPHLALLVNALADGVGVVILADLGRRLTGSRLVGLAAGLIWAISPFSVTFAVGGMETSVVVLFLLALFDAYLAGRSRLAAGLAGLALLTRPDTALAVGPFFLALAMERWQTASQTCQVWAPHPTRRGADCEASRRGNLTGLDHRFALELKRTLSRLPWLEGLITAAVCTPWVLYSVFTFGSPLSNTLSAKTVAYHLDAGGSFVRLIQHLSIPFFEYDTFDSYRPVFGLTVYLSLVVIAILRLTRRDRRALWVASYPLLYIAAFSLANPLIFRWYLAPPTPFYTLLILTGAWFLLRDLARLRRPVHAVAFAILASVPIALTAHGWTAHPDHGPDRPAPRMAFIGLELQYAQAAAWLEPHLLPGQVVAAGDIGVLGYQTNAPLLDTVGLVSPEASQYYPLPADEYVINYAISPQLIAERQPDWLVILEVYGRKTLLRDRNFLEHYQVAYRLDTGLYDSQGMLVFQKQSSPETQQSGQNTTLR